MKTAQQIADEIEARLPLDGIANFSMDALSRADINFALVEAVLEARRSHFKPADESDKYRDLWNENMPRVSGCMYFAIPGEQPLHVNDGQALRILEMLSSEALA